MLQLMQGVARHRRRSADAWQPPVIPTVAVQNRGIEGLLDGLFAHRRHLESNGGLAERQAGNRMHFFRQLVADMAAARLLQDSPELASIQNELACGALDPHTAADRFLNRRLIV